MEENQDQGRGKGKALLKKFRVIKKKGGGKRERRHLEEGKRGGRRALMLSLKKKKKIRAIGERGANFTHKAQGDGLNISLGKRGGGGGGGKKKCLQWERKEK